MPQSLYPHPRDSVPIVQEDGCGPCGWAGQCGNLTPHWGLNPKLSWPEQVTILCHPGSTKINSVVKCQTSKKNTVYAHVYA